MQTQKRVNKWLQDKAFRDDVNEANSLVSRNSQGSSKSRHSIKSRMFSSSLDEVMKNKIELVELELRAKFLGQEKEAEKQTTRNDKATDRTHLNLLDEDIPRDMVSKHVRYDLDHVDQRKTERNLAFKTTENKEKDNF